MTDDDELARIRSRIDEIDGQIQQLLNERASCSLEVGRIKTRSAEDETPVFYRPEREAQILRKIKARNPGPLPADHVAHLFREIISSSLSLEHPLSVAYLGPEGTFTEAAAIKHFGHFAQTQPIATIDDIFAEVESGAVQFGVVPVENSTEGMVNHTLDCLIQTTGPNLWRSGVANSSESYGISGRGSGWDYDCLLARAEPGANPGLAGSTFA